MQDTATRVRDDHMEVTVLLTDSTDVSGDADMPIYFAGVLVFLILPLSAAFRLLQRRLVRPAPVPVTSA